MYISIIWWLNLYNASNNIQYNYLLNELLLGIQSFYIYLNALKYKSIPLNCTSVYVCRLHCFTWVIFICWNQFCQPSFCCIIKILKEQWTLLVMGCIGNNKVIVGIFYLLVISSYYILGWNNENLLLFILIVLFYNYLMI